ncbi:MAG: hypothetical protein MJY90_08015 [Bacteroidaceae bacterium]|nr:hypothetical protein [Bacteroidaceae bacterium]
MEYKANYTDEELNELFQWFESHQFENQVDLGHGEKVFDVKLCVTNMMANIKTNPHHVTFSGLAYKLFCIREALIAQNKVK